MANEITISLSMSASKGGASINTVGATGPATATYDMAGTDMLSGTQILTSTGTTYALNIGSASAPYRAYIMNMGNLSTSPPTGVVTIDRATPVSATPAVTLDVGDECFLVVESGTTIYLTSSVNATTVYVAIVEK